MAAVGGMGWAMHPEALVREHLASGQLVELKPDTALDIQLYWQQTRIAFTLLDQLTRAVVAAAKVALVQAA
jgi:LysR family transcriptional regulator (chromosome initiation inhibitor)